MSEIGRSQPLQARWRPGKLPWAETDPVDTSLLRKSSLPHCDRLDRSALDYFTVDAEGLLVERPSIRTIFLVLSIFRSCRISFTRVHSPSVK